MGFWVAGLWAVGVAWVYLQPETHAALIARVREAVGVHLRLDVAVGLFQHLLIEGKGHRQAEQLEVTTGR